MATGNKRLPFLTGMLAAGLSNLFLGLSSLYWRVFHDMNAIALVGYRVVLSLATVTLILWVKRDLLALFHRLKLRQVVLHGCAAVLVATNWGAFIWASIHGRVLESGLGYLIAPLLSIAVGLLIYRERLSPLKAVALGLVCLSVLFLVTGSGDLDARVYVVIAVTWGLYTWLKKLTSLSPLNGLFVESLVLACALCPLLFLFDEFIPLPTSFGGYEQALLIGCGLVSIIPLALFSFAAGRLPISAMGLLQFILPLTQFIVAVEIYGQPASTYTLLAFAAITFGMVLVIFEPVLKGFLGSNGVEESGSKI
jgi:chloramphenicol-sensitive protein RarD